MKLKKETVEIVGKYLTSFSDIGKPEENYFKHMKPTIVHEIKSTIPRVISLGLKYSGVSLNYSKLATAEDLFSSASSIFRASRVYLAERSRVTKEEAYIQECYQCGIYHPTYLEIFKIIVASNKCYKILLYGPPGTGKSSFWKILRSLNESFVIKISSVEEIPSKVDPLALYVLDDLDLLIAKGREGAASERKSLHKLLSFLDDVKKVVLTTNVIENLDSAVTRAGRIDYQFEIGNINEKSAKKIVEFITYKEINKVTFKKVGDELIDYIFFKIKDKTVEPDGSYSPCKVAKEVGRAFKSIISEYRGIVEIDNNKDLYKSAKKALIEDKKPFMYTITDKGEDFSDWLNEEVCEVLREALNLASVDSELKEDDSKEKDSTQKRPTRKRG